MIDDFLGADEPRRKPKRIEPLEKEPQRSIHDLAAEHDASEQTPPEPAFVPPDEIAETANEVVTNPVDMPSQVKTRPGFFSPRWTLNKQWTIATMILTILFIGCGGATAYFLTRPTVKGGVYQSKNPSKPVPKITTVASTLSGLQVDPSVNQRPVFGVMVENHYPDARPQSGIDKAGVVFEAIAEGGITRFLTLYQDTQPDYIGPVRSARPYYVQWCMSFDCAYAHAGGSPEALADIRAWGTKDLNDTQGFFWRISGRYAPHNLYTSIPKLGELAASKGYGAASFTGFTRKNEQPYKAPAATTPNQKQTATTDTRTPATGINFNISSGQYNARFDYDTTSNTYNRSQGGAAHMVVDSTGAQTQLHPKVVVAIITTYSVASDKHSQYDVLGSGQAFVFQDGTVTTGTWSKSDTAAPLTFTDGAGKPLSLNPGQTWITS
ncbi:DUF3048 domain-containing protein [Candidatus Saccharibacteria bacterium]|nr:MAG: DUF3048 domain-containing protein [Candidatus Saccharibacteria bacterium]